MQTDLSDVKRPQHVLLCYTLIALVAFALRIVIAWDRQIGFDEAWDIFVSRQDTFGEFFRAVAATSHPPLMYAALRLTSWLGNAQISDPLVPILAGVTSIIFVGRILNLLRVPWLIEFGGMLLCALSQSHILISIIIRPYMVAVAFMTASFYYLLVLVSSHFRSRKAELLFFVTLFGGFFSNYCALLYGAALTASFIALLILNRNLRTAFVSELALPWGIFGRHSAGLILTGLFGMYLLASAQGGLFMTKHLLATQDPLQITPYRYLSSYLYTDRQSLPEFIGRALHAEFNLFSPLYIASSGAGIAIVALLLTVSGVLVLRAARSARQEEGANNSPLRFLVLILPLAILMVLLTSSSLGKYPLGGELRQQFFLFPFMVIGLLGALCEISLRRVTVGVITVLLITVSAIRLVKYPLDDSEFGKLPELAKLKSRLVTGTELYMGTWTAFTFYGQNRDWKLQFEGRDEGVTSYVLRRGADTMRLHLDSSVYLSNFLDDATPDKVSGLMRDRKISELHVVGFPRGRMRCVVCDKQQLKAEFAARLGIPEVTLELERTKNGEGFMVVKTGGS